MQNIKRDPFEQAVGISQKTVNAFGGALAASSTAFLYDWNMLPVGQQLWLKHLLSYKEYPPMQAPETGHQIRSCSRSERGNHPSD